MNSSTEFEQGGNRVSAKQVPFEQDALAETMKSGANWFYWIAGLSVVNTVIYVMGNQWSFLAGLGFTQFADGLADVLIQNGGSSVLKGVALVFDFVIVAMFVLFGYYAGKQNWVVFLIGIIVYIFDGLLLLVAGDIPGPAFHAFALFFIVRGFIACRSLHAFASSQPFQAPPPPPVTA